MEFSTFSSVLKSSENYLNIMLMEAVLVSGPNFFFFQVCLHGVYS